MGVVSVETLWRYFLENPVMAAVILLSAGVVMYFVIKKILKYALISLFVFVALSGISYYRAPDEFPDTFRSNLEEIHERGGDAVEKGKAALDRGQRFALFMDRMVEKWNELSSRSDEE